MAKDPNYERYAGIVSLPGADGKMPRPFRVDEDGNVIYLDKKSDVAGLQGGKKAREHARAGILGWNELDRKAEGITVTGAFGPVSKGMKQSKVSRTRKTIGGIDYEVISANTYDPALSNGKTAIPNPDVIARMNADKNQVAVPRGSPAQEKGTRIVRLPFDFSPKADDASANERNLLTNQKGEMYYSLPIINPKTGSTFNADTLNFGDPAALPVGTVALGHGHVDGVSDGMIDHWDPYHKPKAIYGDVHSLLGDNPIPMATVSEGRIGWHQLENGRLEFMYPVGTDIKEHEAKKIQKNLDKQQNLFQRKVP